MSFDQSIFQAINGFANRIPAVDFLAVFLAEYLSYFLILGFFITLFFARNWKLRFYNFALVVISVIASRGILTELIRLMYYRPRPPLVLSIEPLIDLPASSSFPSGHAAVFFALGMALWYENKRVGTWFLAAAVLMGVSRIFVGVHWPVDILGGAAVGILSTVFARRLLRSAKP